MLIWAKLRFYIHSAGGYVECWISFGHFDWKPTIEAYEHFSLGYQVQNNLKVKCMGLLTQIDTRSAESTVKFYLPKDLDALTTYLNNHRKH